MEILFDEHATFGPVKVPVRIFDSEADYHASQWYDTDYWEVNGQLSYRDCGGGTW